MVSLNKVLLIGHLTKDPELRYTPKGIAVANIRLAVNRKYKGSSGEWKEDVCFVTVTAWDKQAETYTKHLQKGCRIFVEGILQSRSWEAPDGQKRSVIEVRADRIGDLSIAKGSAGDAPEGHSAENAPRIAEGVPGADDIAWEE